MKRKTGKGPKVWRGLTLAASVCRSSEDGRGGRRRRRVWVLGTLWASSRDGLRRGLELAIPAEAEAFTAFELKWSQLRGPCGEVAVAWLNDDDQEGTVSGSRWLGEIAMVLEFVSTIAEPVGDLGTETLAEMDLDKMRLVEPSEADSEAFDRLWLAEALAQAAKIGAAEGRGWRFQWRKEPLDCGELNFDDSVAGWGDYAREILAFEEAEALDQAAGPATAQSGGAARL